jgi:hypothetical protein
MSDNILVETLPSVAITVILLAVAVAVFRRRTH